MEIFKSLKENAMNMLGFNPKDTEDSNVKINLFTDNKEKNIEELSVIQQYFEELDKTGGMGNYLNGFQKDPNNPYRVVPTNKIKKLDMYRRAGNSDIVGDAIDELADSAFNLNEDKDCLT